MKFEILAVHHDGERSGEQKTFFYDNISNTLSDDTGFVYEYPDVVTDPRPPYVAFDRDRPLKKSKLITHIKIQMGLSCNYSCDYCSQKFVERAPETNRKDIDNFLAMMDTLEFDEKKGLRIEFWGGEPLVYWKTLKPLAEAIKEKMSYWNPGPQFSIITNGSILSKDMAAWLYYMGFSVSISHDGPGQPTRGPDPFDDVEQKKNIMNLYKILRPQNRISFNPMLHANNKSRLDIYNWFAEMTKDPDVILGEGGIVDAYDEDGATNSLQTLQEHFEYRQTAFNDIFSTGGGIGFKGILDKIDNSTKGILSHSDAKYLGQKCGMDNEHVIAVDLKGNVITCQNVSAAETAMNGESHLGGHITKIEEVAIKSSTHWSQRKECANCPVLQICKGACMFLDKKFWDISCANAYSDNIPLLALSIQKITEYVPVLIKGEGLPPERQDIWGTMYEHKEKEVKKIIPIKVVAEKTVVNDIEVYTQSRIEK